MPQNVQLSKLYSKVRPMCPLKSVLAKAYDREYELLVDIQEVGMVKTPKRL